MQRLFDAVIIGLVLLMPAVSGAQVINTELAGNSLGRYPFFEFVRTFNADSTVEVALDPARFPQVVGKTADLYVVPARPSWPTGTPLTDAGAGPETVTFAAGSVADNRIVVAADGELPGDAGVDLGMPYDIVVDMDRNGLLSDGDLIDGGGSEAGFYVVKDLVEAGPLEVAWTEYSATDVTPGYVKERIWYPKDIAAMGKLPVVIISHGNGHQYDWYDYLQQHLASYGYVVMSHQNNTGPGIETASTTTLEHTDAFLAQQAVIGSGVLNGHLDAGRIVWIGHSRGGEGVARAYDRIQDGDWVPVHYARQDIVLVSSIAPTDFLGPNGANPHGVNYHFIYGSADGDVSGTPSNDIAQAFHVFERATGYRQSTYVHGADHNDFNCCGFDDFTGPPGTAIGRPEAQRVAKAVYLALIKHYVEGNIPAKDYLWRQYERFKPIGVSPTTVVVNEYKEGPESGKAVIDDYQSAESTRLSSSGGKVGFFNVDALQEGLLNDINSNFDWIETDPFNGMTRAQLSDQTRGAVFSITGERALAFMQWEIPAAMQDFSAFKYLSFRACQGTRHPLTTAQLQNVSWIVLLIDEYRRHSLIDFSAYGGGIEEPYQRTGSGSGAGWQNEFETIRIRLTDFLADHSDFDLSHIQQMVFLFPSIAKDHPARLGLDDLELTLD